MSWDYEFEMPWPPSVNSLRACVRGRMITTKRGRDYFNIAIKHLDSIGLSGEGLSGVVRIGLDLHPPTNRKYDCSNMLKAYEDALVKSGFIIDDSQIEYMWIRKCEKKDCGKISISVCLSDIDIKGVI